MSAVTSMNEPCRRKHRNPGVWYRSGRLMRGTLAVRERKPSEKADGPPVYRCGDRLLAPMAAAGRSWRK